MTKLNNSYRISIKSPLLRPGLEIETTVSELYVEDVVRKIMDMVRAINEPQATK